MQLDSVAKPRQKVGVLTFHRCINYGSYWQARSLVEGLRARGHDAVLLDHDCPTVKFKEYRCAFQPLLPKRSSRSDFRLYANKARKVLGAADALPVSTRFALDRPQDVEEFDTIVVGSDEVWNMQHPWYGGKSIFYGDGLPAKRLVSYAASFGNHDADWGLDGAWAEKLRQFDAISVRDENSRTLVRRSLQAEPELVLDPCLQFPPVLDAGDAEERAPYVAVYGHGFPDWYAEAVRAYADARGLRLVSIGYRTDWADEQQIDSSPHEFARLIAGAAAVATNFFHGCVFALLAERPFAAVTSAYRSNKVRDLMMAVGADERLVADPNQIAIQLAQPFSPAITARIAELRRSSEQYLAHAVG